MKKIDVGKNIYEMRVFRNISIADLADNCGVNIETVNKWESGDIIPNAVELFTIAKALNTTADYFSVDIDQDKEYSFFSSDSDALLTVALTTMSAAKGVNPLRRIMLKRTAMEELVNLKLTTLNTPQYSVARTTEKQRRDAVSCFEDIVGDEYKSVLQGYVAGEHEISKLGIEFLERAEEHRLKEQQEKDKKRLNPTWKVYVSVIDYLEATIDNEFIDLSYANRALEELVNYLANKTDSLNDIVLEKMYKKIKVACSEHNVNELQNDLTLLKMYGDMLWYQLA